MSPDTSHQNAFQHFEATTTPQQGVTNVAALRSLMQSMGLDGLIVPHEDEHQNEYLPDANERLAWISGFTGSAGAAVILMDRATLFADGRYRLQSREQTDPTVFDVMDFHATSLSDYLADLRAGLTIGYDPRLHSPDGLMQMQFGANRAGVHLIAVDPNPLDQAWGAQRPAQPMGAMAPQPLHLSGVSSDEKRQAIAQELTKKGIKAALITAPSSLAWLFNIRGADVIRSPLPLGQALIYDDASAELFVELQKTSPELSVHLGNTVSVKSPDEIKSSLQSLMGRNLGFDPSVSSCFWQDLMAKSGAHPVKIDDPCALPRARKNAVEIASTTKAHIRDGAVMATFLHWLATEAQTLLPTEIEIAQKLESLRMETGLLKDLSFDTISAFGPHGALPHYRVNLDSNLKCAPGNLLLVDSGAQFVDGTTDITRTVPIGTPTQDHKRMFTLVLKGHIALATIRFPLGTTGTHLDTLARQFLWAQGFDYDHGTGHGVGVFLGVHEGPQRIAKALNPYALEPGMIVSNEPGYYKEGDFGIRIENLQYVTPLHAIKGGERPMLGFETLTLAPIDRDLIELSLLSEAERAYMDAYHARVLNELAPLVNPEVAQWLKSVCAPL